MARPVPKVAGFSIVVGAGAHVDPYDAWLLGRALAAAKPNLDAFLWGAGLAREERERLLSLVDAFGELGDEWAAARETGSARQKPPGEISSREAASRLGGLTPQRVGQLVREGRLDGRRVGGRLMLARTSVEALRAARDST